MSDSRMDRVQGNDHNRQGVLIVGHGTRDEQGRDEFEQLVAVIRTQLVERDVRRAFIELQEPEIAECIVQMAADGICSVTIAPVLLFAAGHARRDIPAAVDVALKRLRSRELAAAGKPRQLTVRFASHLGCHPAVVRLSQQRSEQSLLGRKNRTALLMVGRGSSTPEAIEEMQAFVQLRQMQEPAVSFRTAFLAVAEPRLADAVAELQRLPFEEVIVQPHLLFDGALLKSLQQRIREVDGQQSSQRWLMTPHLGPAAEVAQSVIDRCREAESTPGVPTTWPVSEAQIGRS